MTASSGTDRSAVPLVRTEAELARLQRRTSGVLMASQVLGGLGVPISIALAPVLATRISGTEALSGFASTAAVIGTAVVSLPLAALMTARGRRPGLVLGYGIGAVGAALVVLAAVVESFPLLMIGMAAFGAAS
ncbi:MFS transporter, partial [Streptomyces sp. NPDC059233]